MRQDEREVVHTYLPPPDVQAQRRYAIGERHVGIGLQARDETQLLLTLRFKGRVPRDAFLARARDVHAVIDEDSLRPKAAEAVIVRRRVVELPDWRDLRQWAKLTLIDVCKDDLATFLRQNGVEIEQGATQLEMADAVQAHIFEHLNTGDDDDDDDDDEDEELVDC